eukprot:scaffold14907_cov74-Cyclotella_meneghiniana.AAC.3
MATQSRSKGKISSLVYGPYADHPARTTLMIQGVLQATQFFSSDKLKGDIRPMQKAFGSRLEIFMLGRTYCYARVIKQMVVCEFEGGRGNNNSSTASYQAKTSSPMPFVMWNDFIVTSLSEFVWAQSSGLSEQTYK